MRTKYLLVLLLLVNCANAQTVTRKVMDEETHVPVPYATIKVLHTTKGVMSSENGEFVVEIDPTDSVLITSVGYEKVVLVGKEIGSVIQMKTKPKSLDEVEVRNKKYVRTVVLGEDVWHVKRERNRNWGPGGDPLLSSKEEFAQAFVLPDPGSWYIIKALLIPVHKFSCYGPLFLRIYTEEEGCDKPGEEILKRIVYPGKENTKRNVCNVDLSAEKVTIKEGKAFYVSIGWLPGAGKENCLTLLPMTLSLSSNCSYSRTLYSPTFQWFQFGIRRDGQRECTFFAAEVDELR